MSVDRLLGEVQAAHSTGDNKRASRLQNELDEAKETLMELEDFSKRLEELTKPRPHPTVLPDDASWVERKIAEVRDNGYNPVSDYGVMVNITPLIEAGVLHPAANRIR